MSYLNLLTIVLIDIDQRTVTLNEIAEGSNVALRTISRIANNDSYAPSYDTLEKINAYFNEKGTE